MGALSPEERARRAEELRAQRAKAAAGLWCGANAMAEAIDVWRRGVKDGHSPYLERKGVTGEACRYLARPFCAALAGRAWGG